jgi:hypothetical protein
MENLTTKSSQNGKHKENSGQKHAQSTFKFEGGHRQLRISGHLLPSTTSSSNATQHVVPIPSNIHNLFFPPFFSLRAASNFVILLFNHEINKKRPPHTAKSPTTAKKKNPKITQKKILGGRNLFLSSLKKSHDHQLSVAEDVEELGSLFFCLLCLCHEPIPGNNSI